MSTFFSEHAVLIALVCGAITVLYGLILTRWVLSKPQGDDKMREIAAAIQEGASAYLSRQYRTVAIVAVVLALVLLLVPDLGGWRVAGLRAVRGRRTVVRAGILRLLVVGNGREGGRPPGVDRGTVLLPGLDVVAAAPDHVEHVGERGGGRGRGEVGVGRGEDAAHRFRPRLRRPTPES